jgi:hypothetical protein
MKTIKTMNKYKQKIAAYYILFWLYTERIFKVLFSGTYNFEKSIKSSVDKTYSLQSIFVRLNSIFNIDKIYEDIQKGEKSAETEKLRQRIEEVSLRIDNYTKEDWIKVYDKIDRFKKTKTIDRETDENGKVLEEHLDLDYEVYYKTFREGKIVNYEYSLRQKKEILEKVIKKNGEKIVEFDGERKTITIKQKEYSVIKKDYLENKIYDICFNIIENPDFTNKHTTENSKVKAFIRLSIPKMEFHQTLSQYLLEQYKNIEEIRFENKFKEYKTYIFKDLEFVNVVEDKNYTFLFYQNL